MGAHQSSDAVVDLSVKVEETVKIEQPVNDEKQTKSTPQDDEMSSAMAYRTRFMSSEQQQHEQQHEQEMRAHSDVERGRIRVALPAIDSLGIGRQGFGARRGLPRLSARQSDAFGSAGRRAPEGAAVAAPSGGLGAPARGNERGTGRRTHYAAPTRPPVCVSGSRTRPTR